MHGWPSEEEANQLLDLVILNVGISQHLFDIRSFSDNLARLYHDTGNETPLRGLWFVQVLFVLALGRLLRAGTDEDLEVPGVAFFNEAMRHMPAMSDVGKHGILGIEVVGLAALFLQVADRKDEAYLYVRSSPICPCNNTDLRAGKYSLAFGNKQWHAQGKPKPDVFSIRFCASKSPLVVSLHAGKVFFLTLISLATDTNA